MDFDPDTLRHGTSSRDLQRQVRDATLKLSNGDMARHWAQLIGNGEKPTLFSSRDGHLLKPVPEGIRLDPEAFAVVLTEVLEEFLRKESQRLLYVAWAKGREPGRAALSLLRAFAYCQAKQAQQGLKDAKVALTYGPQREGCSCWGWAHAAQSAALELMAQNTLAALAMCKAVELDSSNPRHLQHLDRLLRRIPQEHAAALHASGSKGLEAWLADEEERNKPEFKRARPKYYYYYEWMKQRIGESCGELPSCVLHKLLALDANELDMLLTFSQGIKLQSQRLLSILEDKGEHFLETYRMPHLSWQEAQALKAEHEHLALQHELKGGSKTCSAAIEEGKGAEGTGKFSLQEVSDDEEYEDFDALVLP